jgi:hypothetical protein
MIRNMLRQVHQLEEMKGLKAVIAGEGQPLTTNMVFHDFVGLFQHLCIDLFALYFGQHVIWDNSYF